MLYTYEHGNIEKNAVQNFTKKYIFFLFQRSYNYKYKILIELRRILVETQISSW